jgi:hypothetical protein
MPNTTPDKKETPQRARPVLLRFFVDEAERAVIGEKMTALGTANLSAYLRKMAVDGYVIHVDYSPLKECAAAISKVGANVNQIARRANAGGTVSEADIAEVKEALAEIWRTQRSILSKAL